MNTTIRKTLQTFDEAMETWFDTYTAPGIEDRPVSAEVRRDDTDPNVVRRQLKKKGALLPPLEQCRDELKVAIAGEAPIIRRAAHNGWRYDETLDQDLFVTFNNVAGITNGCSVVPPIGAFGSTGQIDTSGSLKGWKSLVAVAEYSTAMIIALCAAFAAPLLKIVNRPSFGLLFYGPSHAGKSTAELVGASVLGFGVDEDLPSLNTTEAGLLATGLAFNDHLLPINEAGTAPGGKRNVAEAVRRATYALMNGHDVIRHPSWSGNNSSATSFKVLPLLSSEFSP